MNIGANLIKLREEKGLKQHELAELINVSSKTISSYENNRSLPNIEILILLANALDTNIDVILGRTKESSKIINQAYEKKSLKEKIINNLLIGILFIIPIFFFTYGMQVTLQSMAAGILAGIKDVQQAFEDSISFSYSFINIYLVYLIILLINYLLYKKKCYKLLLLINGFIIALFFVDFITNGLLVMLDIYILIIAAIVGIIFGIKLLIQKKH